MAGRVARARPTPLAALALVWLVVIDVANGVNVAGVSGGALLTIGSAIFAAATAAAYAAGRYARIDPDLEPRFPSGGGSVLPLALVGFVAWAVGMALLDASASGAQNVAVYAGFLLTAGVTAALSSAGTADLLLDRLRVAAILVACIYLGTVLIDGTESALIYTPRAFALTALILLAAAVAQGRSRWLPWLILAALVCSLSRTAVVVGVLLVFMGYAARGRAAGRFSRIVVMFAVSVAAAYLAVTRIGPLRERFLGGDAAVQYRGVDLNTSGRLVVWEHVWNGAQEHLWFGSGAGSAETYVSERYPVVIHPHNDYLRLLFDFGLVGLALFVAGAAVLGYRIWLRARMDGHPIHWSALMSLAAVALAALTDNVLVYPFAMIPLGLVVGASLGRPTIGPTWELDRVPEASIGLISGLLAGGQSRRRGAVDGSARAVHGRSQ